MEPVGVHQFWGFSPALDLQQLYRTAFGSAASEAPDNEPLNFLLLSPGDSRHILKTVAQRRRHSARPLHFYVIERNVELVARHMLQLAVACEWGLPLRQRVAIWLELYGNALLQSRTAAYLGAQLAPMLTALLCDGKGPAPLVTTCDFSLLKHRQRDELEVVFKSWAEGVPFDMPALRDARLRHHYAERYDFRNNLIDWDYQTHTRTVAGCVHYTQFRGWRNSGVAFEFGDCAYVAPNRSLASFAEGREPGRGSVARRGFWGDVVVSPYHAMGTATYVPTDDEAAAAAAEERAVAASSSSSAVAATPAARDGSGGGGGNFSAGLFEVQARHLGSEQWRHHAVEIATHSVLAWMHEVETGRPYVMRGEHDVYSGLAATVITSAQAAAAATADATADAGSSSRSSGGVTSSAAAATPATTAAPAAIASAPPPAPATLAFAGVSVTFIAGDAEEWLAKGRLAGRFHGVTLSGRTVHLMDRPGFAALAATAGEATAAAGEGKSAAAAAASRGAERPTATESGADAVSEAAGTNGLGGGGCIVVAETARNVVTLKAAQQVEFARRVAGMAALAGAALVGGDRELSADAFAVGSVLAPMRAATAASAAAAAASAAEAGWTNTTMFRAGPGPFLAAIQGKPSSTKPATAAAAAAAAAARQQRVKGVPMHYLSHAPLPHPAVAPLVLAAATEGAASSDGAPGPLLAAAAGAAAARLRYAIAEGIPAHDPAGGDCPAPEALVFALVGGGGSAATAAVRAAFTALLKAQAQQTPPAAAGATGVGPEKEEEAAATASAAAGESI